MRLLSPLFRLLSRVVPGAVARPLSLIVGTVALLATALPSAASSYRYAVNVDLVTLCGGSLPENTRGNDCWSSNIDTGYLQSIFDQVAIKVNLNEGPLIYNMPFTRDAAGEVSSKTALASMADILGKNGYPAPHTAYIGFTPDLEGNVVGRAYLGDPSRPYTVLQGDESEGLLRFLPGTMRSAPADIMARAGATTLAHELGHILGGEHLHPNGFNALMNDTFALAFHDDPDYLPMISERSRQAFYGSDLLAPIPVPPALPLLAVAMLGLWWVRRQAA